MIPFNKPFIIGNELTYIEKAVNSGKISGNGQFTARCQAFFSDHLKGSKTLLTTSCSDALEMAAILVDIKPGDEIILPSFTFVSTANAFLLRGAKLVFVDSEDLTPNIDANKIEPLITAKTKAIVCVHYAGIACEMDKLLQLSDQYDLYLIEDAAQAFGAFYRKQPLGSVGNIGTFSFHETKNIISGEGGLLAINDKKFEDRSEIIWEKGTNRSAFFRGEIDKYDWIDIGSSFLPSEIIAAFLWGQLEHADEIQNKRMQIWNQYSNGLMDLQEKEKVKLPFIPEYASNNAHMFYLICNSLKNRNELLKFLNSNGVNAIFHYLPLHQSKFFTKKHDQRNLPNCIKYSEQLVRLPLFYNIKENEINFIIDMVHLFFRKHLNSDTIK